VMQQLFAAGYPVPMVMRFEEDPAHLGGPFIVMEQIHGRSMGWHYRNGTPERKREIMRLYGDLLVRLHSLDCRAFVGPGCVWETAPASRSPLEPDVIAFFIRRSSIGGALAPMLDWISRHSRELQGEQRCLVHGDFHVWNILMKDDRTPSVLDWGQVGIGDPRRDIAYPVILAETERRPDLAKDIREAYEAASGKPLRDFEACEILALFRRFGGVMVSMADGAETLGLLTGLEAYMFARLGEVRRLYDHVVARSGVRMPDIEELLNRWQESRR